MATYKNAKFLFSPSFSDTEMTEAQFLALTDYVALDLVGDMPAFGTNDEFTNYDTVDTDYSDQDKSTSSGAETTIEVKFNASSASQKQIVELAKTAYKYPVCVRFNDPISSGSTVTHLFTRALIGGPAYPQGGNSQTITATFAIRQVQREITLYAANNGTAPANSVAPVIAGTGTVGETLSVTSVGTWTGSDLKYYTYQWQADGSNIEDATSDSFVLTADESGADVTCVVTAHNSLGDVAQASNAISVS